MEWEPYAVCTRQRWYMIWWYHRPSGQWYREMGYRYKTLAQVRKRCPRAVRAFWLDPYVE